MDLLSNRPTREGVRGGQGSFSWDAVKQDKYRQNYLGHSVMAPTGRWAQKNDALWYSKEKGGPVENELDMEGLGEEEIQLTKKELRKIELRRIKEAEEIAMAEALGIKPRLKSDDHKEGSVGHSAAETVSQRRSRSRSRSPEPGRRSSRSERDSRRRYPDDRSPRPQRSHHHSRDDDRMDGYNRRRDDYRSRDDDRRHHRSGSDDRYRRGREENQGRRHHSSRDRPRDDDEEEGSNVQQRGGSQERERRDSKYYNDSRKRRQRDEVDQFLDGFKKADIDEFVHPSRRNLVRE
ncbi:kinase phosphorylation protein-domain-containing protein [Lipomyces tetrasporus]|uniref:Kinase phosphorylation protein-domain-containing protein n=1 Tax=Lipomyces tetrasporus TaxID=54092 RepID=A0AAD7QU40_9ASCO|nr:kinase phosphorylation protein-domain-containing protein [Lipomyces tetrasporus]KAJ8101495.1 kinase phosphorylation protein-domain-containing protein [Lipomyces tetrasporus]